MARLLKGEVRWVDIEPVAQVTGHEQGNPRPVLILSGNSYNQNSGLVIAAMITASPRRRTGLYSVEIQSFRMPRQSWVLTGQIRTLSAERVRDLIGRVSETEMNRVQSSLLRILEI